MEPNDNNGDGDGDGDGDVWTGFELSAAYLRQLAALYQDSFTAAKKPVAKAHVLEAQRQAREALELLAGNLLNASSAVLARIEAQDATVEVLQGKLDGVRAALRGRQRMADEQVIRQFYGLTRDQRRLLGGPNAAGEPHDANYEPEQQV